MLVKLYEKSVNVYALREDQMPQLPTVGQLRQ
jgi:hypothetical protein